MKLTKQALKRIIKEELQATLEEGPRMDAMLAKKAAERDYDAHSDAIDPLRDRFQTDDTYSDRQYVDDIMAIAPGITEEQAIAIAELFSDEVGLAIQQGR